MKTIETTAVDAYAQNLLTDTSMSPAERAQHVAASMYVHVMTEMGLPMTTTVELDTLTIESQEAHLEGKAERAMNDLYEKSFEAFEYVEALAPERSGDGAAA